MKFNPFVAILEHYKALLKGDLPLWQVFWIHFILLPILLNVCIYSLLEINVTFDFMPFGMPITIIWASIYTLLLYFPFMTLALCFVKKRTWLNFLAIGIGVYITYTYGNLMLFPPPLRTPISKNEYTIRDSAAMVSQSLTLHKYYSDLTATTHLNDFKSNWYTKGEDKNRLIDSITGETSLNCADSNVTCILLNNGAVMAFNPKETLGGLTETNALRFVIDPDGTYSGKRITPTAEGNVKSVAIYLYTNGRLTTDSTLVENTHSSLGHYKRDASKVPEWLEWGK